MKLTLTDDEGMVHGTWSIGTEYDFDIEDLDAEGAHDFYLTRKKCERLGYEKVGHSIGEEIARMIALVKGWL